MNELDSNDKFLLKRANDKLNAANEIIRFLADYFRDKYNLTPASQITPDGQIIQVSPPINTDGVSDSERENKHSPTL